MAELVQRVPSDLSRPLRVIGAGMGRTGTASFTAALEILLKGPALHCGSASLYREEDFIKKWIKVLELSVEPENNRDVVLKMLRHLCNGYVALTDAQATMFVGELLDAYPDAVVICTTRDPKKWWASFEPVANTVYLLKALNLLFMPLPTVRYFGAWVDALSKRSAFLYTDGGKAYRVSKDHLSIHEDYVRHVTPREKLFFYEVKQGWEPLCRILNEPVPDVPFPHINDAAAVQEALQDFIKRALVRWVFIIGMLLGIYFLYRSLATIGS